MALDTSRSITGAARIFSPRVRACQRAPAIALSAARLRPRQSGRTLVPDLLVLLPYRAVLAWPFHRLTRTSQPARGRIHRSAYDASRSFIVNMRASLLLCLSCFLVACSFSDDRGDQHCKTSNDCDPDEHCFQGFCVGEDESSSNASSEAGAGGKSGSTGSSTNGNSSGGSKSSAGKGGSGASGSGGRSSAANGGKPAKPGSMPASGPCKDGEEQPCLVDPSSTTASEMCNRGTQRCSGDQWGTCVGAPEPGVEECNGLDDDCNGMVDDLTEDCYPDGQAGCTQGSDQRWSCEGLCAVGKRTCANGKPGECTGFKVPATEVCSGPGQPAADENCNGMIDETCTCTAGETRSCYNGPTGTLNVGKCVAGTQTCSNGALGTCMNAVVPVNETCANTGTDDNCDGMLDNVPTLGNACVVAANMGPCRAGLLQCQAGKAEPACVATITPTPETCNNIDDDCNGTVDDTFNLQTDAQNCGTCGMRCPAGNTCVAGRCMMQGGAAGMPPAAGAGAGGAGAPAAGAPAAGAPAAGAPAAGAPAAGAPAAGSPSPPTCQPACGAGRMCCGTTCVDLATDPMNCGACGAACTTGAQPGCCAGRCVDLVSNTNCGQCGRDCSLLSTSGITCTCTKASDGSISCMGPVLNVCL
jgi:hypothetical protein